MAHPAEYHLDIKQCEREGDTHADAEGCVTAHVDVSQQVYESHPDGSEIVLPEQ